MKKHRVTEMNEKYSPAYLANGVVGLRVGTNPFVGQTGLLAGFTGSHERFGVEAFAPVPAPEYDVAMDGSSLVNHLSGYELKEQGYDFSNGELETTFVYKNKRGQILDGKSLVYISRSCPTMAIHEVEFTPRQDCELDFSVALDPTKLPVHTNLTVVPREDCDGVLLLESRDRSGTAGISHLLKPDEEAYEINYDWGYEQERLQKRYGIKAKENKSYRFSHMISYVPGVLHSEPHWQAVRMIKLATWKGFERLRMENRKEWEKLWESRIVVKGAAERWQDVIDASFFYLYCSIHPSSPESMAPYGLSQRDLYKGHVFWDTESFMLTLPLLTNRACARAILDYRFERLEAARHNAMINGYNGIQFPCQSGVTGDEVTRVSAGGAGGAGEQHFCIDIALAFVAYWKVTGDLLFLQTKGWKVIREACAWIENRVEKTDRGYEISFVTGIDESSDNVNNDSFTNIICKLMLGYGNEAAKTLGYPANQSWSRIAENIYIPLSEKGDYIPQYEGCKERPSMPPESLMAFFPCGYCHSKEVDENTYRFFIEHNMKFYLSYPMLSGFLGIIPARLGDRKKAAEFFEYGNFPFFKGPYLMCTEWACTDSQSDRGHEIFITGRGSLMTGLMLGLTRINIYREHFEDWFEGPIVLPEGFDEVVLQKVWVKGRPARITAKHGAPRAELIWLDETI